MLVCIMSNVHSVHLFTIDALKVVQDPAKMDKDVMSLTDQSNKQEIVEEPQSKEEASNEVNMALKTTTTTAIDKPHNSLVICPSRTFLLFFILSTSFVVILSFWMKW